MKATIVSVQPTFDPVKDAKVLHKAMCCFGTNEKKIIDVLANRSSNQRLQITEKFDAKHGKKKDLLTRMRKELSGDFQRLVLATLAPPAELAAQELHDAMSGVGTNENTLVEILCTLNNEWTRKITSAYMKMFNTALERDIKKDTSGTFERLLVALCQANRDEGPVVNIATAKIDAQTLISAGEGRWGTDESKFIEILTTRSYQQLRQVFKEYEVIACRPFEEAVKSEFSGDAEKGVLAMVHSVQSCASFLAEHLHASMAGPGTKDRALIRLVVTRADFDLKDIKVAYEAKYGKTLASVVQSDTSGDYRKMLLAIIG